MPPSATGAETTTDGAETQAPGPEAAATTEVTTPAEGAAPAATVTDTTVTEAPTPDATVEQADEAAKTEDEPLGEAGKKALLAERDAHTELKREFAAFRETAVAKTDHDAVAAERDSLKAEVDKYKTADLQRTATDAIKAAAVEAGAKKPAVVARLVSLADYDHAKGNAKDLIAALKSDPDTADLFGPQTQPGLGTQDGPSAGKSAPHFTREQVSAMSTEEYAANRDHIFASMKTW